MLKNSIRGCLVYFPEDMKIWRIIEKSLSNILNSYSYQEIQFPIIEETELFHKSIGTETDIITKEMYTFKDRSKTSITLRPEGTIGCVRIMAERRKKNCLEDRVWYIGPMFRYERPQKGRYRQFSQLGIEAFGLKSPEIDLEMLILSCHFWSQLNISNFVYLEINTIGSVCSRNIYKKDLFSFLKKHENELDQVSKRQLYTNPLRILDTKNLSVQELLKKAPILLNYLDKKSISNFETLCRFLDRMKIKYSINTKLVRGLDYYNDTVFEWKSDFLGAQNTICGGGRYDFLFEKFGGRTTSSIGCAVGIDRVMLLIKNLFSKKSKKVPIEIDIYIAFLHKSLFIKAIEISEKIRFSLPKLKIKIDFSVGNISNTLRKANRNFSKVILLLGLKEVKKGAVLIKNLYKNDQFDVSEKNLISEIKKIFKDNVFNKKFNEDDNLSNT